MKDMDEYMKDMDDFVNIKNYPVSIIRIVR